MLTPLFGLSWDNSSLCAAAMCHVKSSFSLLTQDNEDEDDEGRSSGEEEGIRC